MATMFELLRVRGEIYDHFHGSSAPTFFSRMENADAFAAYYTSMYLLQDTGEALLTHIKRGFAEDPMAAYLEFWGIMQATIIQQDSIVELHEVVIGKLGEPGPFWKRLRDLRHACSGHPAKRARGVSGTQRTFMGRSFGDYDSIQYETWDASTKRTTHPVVNLRELMAGYETEASAILRTILSKMKLRWP